VREEISREKGKKKAKWESVRYKHNKQTIYTAPKSKIETRVHYVPEPAWGAQMGRQTKNIKPPAPSTGRHKNGIPSA